MKEQTAIAHRSAIMKRSGTRATSRKILIGGTVSMLALGTGAVLGAGFDLSADAENTDALLVHTFDGTPLNLNNDGFVDLVVGNVADPSRIYFGVGDGTFTESAATLSTGFTTRDLDAGDIDGDGALDIVQANNGEVNNYFLGDGAGNFAAAVAIAAETEASVSIELADMNGDTLLDVVIGNSNNDQVNRVYPNTTVAGVVSFGPPVDISGDTDFTRHLEVGDLDGDGDLDVVAANDDRAVGGSSGTEPTKVYLNTFADTGTFGFDAAIAVAQAGESVDDLELADLDNDGDLDLVKVTFTAENEFFLNQLVESGTDMFSFDGGTDISPDVNHSNAVEVVDVDGDGDLDVIVGNGSTTVPATPEVNRLYLNQFVESGNMTVSFDAGQNITDDLFITRDIVSIDLDMMNGPDVISGERNARNRVYLNDGTATPFADAAPEFTSTPVTEATVGVVYTYDVTAEDQDPEDAGEALAITDDGTLPAWLTLTDNGDGTATLTGTPAITDIGDVDVTLTATNTVDSTATDQMFTITVAAADPLNTPPAFTSTPVTEATVDEAYTYEVTAEDADGDTLTIVAVTLPAWLTLTDHGDGTATLSGTPAAADAGTHDVTLEVSDGTAAPVPQDFTVTVTETEDTTPPVITLIGPATVTVTVGSTYNDQGATATDDVDGDLTDEIVTDSNVDTSTAGSYTVTYNVTDAAGNEAATVTRTVNVSQPPRDSGGGGGSLGLWSLFALLGLSGAAGRRRRS